MLEGRNFIPKIYWNHLKSNDGITNTCEPFYLYLKYLFSKSNYLMTTKELKSKLNMNEYEIWSDTKKYNL